MAPDQHKRPRRTPLSPEEVANVIAFKKEKERRRLVKLKSSLSYKLQNIFNVGCFFIYCELLFCYFGPCNYQTHYSENVNGIFGQEAKGDGTPILAEVDMSCLHGQTYKFIVDDYVKAPPKLGVFEVGKDFLLAKDIKGSFEGSADTYRIFSASPILFLSIFISVIMLIGIGYNLNENEYSLSGLTIVNSMTLLCVLLM
ncbi:MAG: hypothetical protein PSX36_00595 [bacterium]|nr:hypothetical protein [bacterium]